MIFTLKRKDLVQILHSIMLAPFARLFILIVFLDPANAHHPHPPSLLFSRSSPSAVTLAFHSLLYSLSKPCSM